MKCPRGRSLAFLVLLTAAGPSLLAEEVRESLRFGMELLVAAPVGDLRDMALKTGRGGALFAEQEFTETSVIQTRISYITHPDNKDVFIAKSYPFLPVNPLTLTVNATALGVEVRQYLTRSRGAFVLAGLSASRYEFRSTYRGTAVDQNGITLEGLYERKYKTSTKIGLSLGLGYDFGTRAGLTVRYTAMPIDGATLATAMGGLSVRF